MPFQKSVPVVGIVGGGFTGATVALHLANTFGKRKPPKIVVFEPRERLGAGLAYDTAEPVHRINVPAGRMSAYPDDPESFTRWLEKTDALVDDPEAFSADGTPFPRRAIFGRYVAAQLAPLLSSGIVEHRRTTVSEIARDAGRWIVQPQDGQTTEVDILVVAVSHPSPSLPRSLRAIASHPKLIGDATRPDALAPIEPSDRVLVVGNGLTAADVIAALRRRGHRGAITAISRRGLRSRGHSKSVQDPFGDFLDHPSPTASHLLHRVRQQIAAAVRAGFTWHAVLDTVRSQAQTIWAGLPVAERRRIVRHLRPFWDVHRFRIAPQVEHALDEAVEDGSLSILAASVLSAKQGDDGFHLLLRKRHATEPMPLVVDAVVVTTGPGHGSILQSQPFLSGLAENGLLTLCPTGLGILNDRTARAVTAQGEHLETLFIAGPLARGTVGELMGLPQVTEHAVLVAQQVADILSAGPTGDPVKPAAFKKQAALP
ncbi:putative NAD(P)/FAD-binding protein YdhS [Pararhizobium capsulatum DSM 1112]|uniref:NAD(P)/FAD-binding protein YdhS n=1 Tax=Pararhizobium capsulatum DSM 1112 TaxID=1121113 RepID=A0ABU0BUN6_9HYPH|nr:FAD/NAD(P)-binding protein [Pararhizobium capsulatum]MDQ0321683.1 putative NAD(P)/FAD-binding protein YdhS [Pararhizobium capsulatum DSM 1112]